MKMNKKPAVVEEEEFKRSVRASLVKRHIVNMSAMLVWHRSQKQKKVDANVRRVKKAQQQMKWLEEMIEEEDSKDAEEETINDS